MRNDKLKPQLQYRMIKVLLAEDHNIVRNGIRMLLETDQEIHIVAEATNGKDVLKYIAQGEAIDIVLADINMPEMDGITLIQELRSLSSTTKVVILSMHDKEKYVMQAFSKGAAGYLLKSVSAEELIFGIKHIYSGSRYLCAELAMKMLDKLSSVQFTTGELSSEFSSRELEVLKLIAEGLTSSEMSDKLFISKRTIEGHRQSLIDKTGSKNTAALIRFAVINGIVT